MCEHAATSPPRTRSRVFPARADQVREARKLVRAALESCPVADDAVLCVSELATNAVLHSDSKNADGTFTVRVEIHYGDYVWIEVEDNGGPWDKRAHSDGRPHGLDIVGELASAWGIDGDPLTGWVVWARFDMPPAGPPHPASRGKGTVSSSEPAEGEKTTVTGPGQALTGPRAALTALGIATAGLTIARYTGKLHPEHGPAIGAADDQHRGITATVQAECQRLQALEDAIAYRRARVTAPCPDCTASDRTCDDHACDLNLIAAYQRTAVAILDASSQTPATPLGPRRHPG